MKLINKKYIELVIIYEAGKTYDIRGNIKKQAPEVNFNGPSFCKPNYEEHIIINNDAISLEFLNDELWERKNDTMVSKGGVYLRINEDAGVNKKVFFQTSNPLLFKDLLNNDNPLIQIPNV